MKYLVLLILSLFCFFGIQSQENLRTLTIEPVKFNQITYAYLNIEKSDTFKLEVYDRYGKLILLVFENNYLTNGNYKFKIDLSPFSLKENSYLFLLRSPTTKFNAIGIKLNSIEDISNSIKLFPNPVKDEFNFDKTIFGDITIIDLAGKEVFKTEINDWKMTLPYFTPGNYYLHIKEHFNSEVEIVPFIKL